MTKSIIKKIEDEKDEIREGIAEFGLATREKILYWGDRLRQLQTKIKGEFSEYLETLPISRRTAYNWITASKQIAEGKQADSISNLFTYEPPCATFAHEDSPPCATFAHEDSVLTSTYDDCDDENDPDDDFEIEPKSSKKPVTAHVIDNDKTPTDRYGQEIPEVLQEPFAYTNATYNKWKNIVSNLKSEMSEKAGTFGYETLDKKVFGPRLDNLLEIFRVLRPHCICPLCGGDGGTGSTCNVCKGRGLVTKPVFDAIPAEFKIGLNLDKE